MRQEINRGTRRIAHLLGLGLLASALTVGVAEAQTFGDLVDNTNENVMTPVSTFFVAFCYVAGFAALLFVGVKFLRSGNGNPHDQVPYGKMGALVLAGAVMIGMPSFLGMGAESLFGTGDTTSVGGTLTSVGGGGAP